MKKIPFRNYFILVGLLVVSVIAFLYLVEWYKETQKNSSIMSEYCSELKMIELDNYIIENSNFIIYMSSKENNKIKNFEKKLKELVLSKNLLKETIYMDIDQFDNITFNQFIKKYYDNDSKFILNDVVVIVLENQRIKDVFIKNIDEININDIKLFLKENGVY